MRLILCTIILLCLACDEPTPTAPPVPSKVQIAVTAGSQFVEGIYISVENSDAGHLLWYGRLPFTVKAAVGDSLTAHFSVDVSNFDLNNPECQCEDQRGNICHEPYIVGSDSVWVIAD